MYSPDQTGDQLDDINFEDFKKGIFDCGYADGDNNLDFDSKIDKVIGIGN